MVCLALDKMMFNIQVKEHFFHGFNQWIDEMLDPRNESYTSYTQTDLIYLGILKNVCAVESMRQMNEKFNEKECIQTLGDRKSVV